MPISLGQITFGIGADTQRLRTSISDITNFGRAVEAAAASTAAGSNTTSAAMLRQERAAISALQKVQKFQDAVGRMQAPEALIQGFNRLSTRNLDLLIQRMTMGQLSTIQFQREMERFGQSMTNAQRILKNYTEAQKRAEATTLVASMQKLSSAAVLVAGPLSGIATRLTVLTGLAENFNIAWASMIAGIAAGSFAFYKVATSAIAVEKQLQNVSLSLEAVYGSATVANVQFRYLSELSDKTGVSFLDLAKQFGQVTAAAKGTNLEGERVRKVFEAIVFAGAKLGLSNEEVKGSLVAVQQMISKGTVSSEELRQQLGDRLPGAVQIMAAAVGVSTQKLQDMMKQGQVSSTVLVRFAEELLKRYNIDQAQRIDTITAAEQRLNNARTRALDILDKQIGFSSAYVHVLNYLTDGLRGLSESSSRLIQVLGAVSGALVGAFAGTAVVRGLALIAAGVRSVASAVAALNFATVAGAAGGLLTVIARLGLAVAGGVAGFKLMEGVIDGTAQSFLSAKPAVEEYLRAQQKMVSSDRKPTLEYLEEQKQKLEELTTARKALVDSASPSFGRIKLAEEMGATTEQLDDLWKKMGVGPARTGLQNYDNQISRTKENIAGLNKLLERQSEVEDKPRKDPVADMTNRQIGSIKRAEESIRTLQARYDNLFKSPAARQQAEMMETVTHQTEQFKLTLERAQVPATKIKSLVDEYHASLLRLKEGELIIRNQVSAFQLLGNVFSSGVDQGLNEFVNVITEGKDKMVAFGDTVKYIAKDILRTLLQLAALNPLKNFLFGMNTPVLGGGGGIGGFLGNLFNTNSGSLGIPSFLTGGSVSGFRSGGIMSSAGEVPLRRYRAGGVAAGAQMALYGEGSQREAYVPLPDGRSIPVNMNGSSGGVEFHIHEAPGTKVTQQTSKSSSGGTRIDVLVQQMVRDAFHSDMASGGPMSRSVEKQFGLNRAKGIA